MLSQREIMEKKSGGGWLALFGLPFFLMGSFAFRAAVMGQMKDESGNPQDPLIGALISSVFILVGLGFILVRAGTIIDKSSGTITTWWGLLRPMIKKVRRLGDFEYVTLTREVVQTDKSSRTIYPVRVAGGGEKKVTWETANTADKGRIAAEKLSKYLEFALRDATTGKTIIREAAHLDESVADRAQRLGEQVEWPKLPAASKIEYETVSDSAIIRLPKTRASALALVMAIPAAIMIFFAVTIFTIPMTGELDGMPGFVKIFMAGFGVLFLGGMLVAVVLPIMRLGGHDTIKASWEGIEVERQFRVGNRKWHIAADELEELEIAQSGLGDAGVSPRVRQMGQFFASFSGRSGVRARSDQHSVSFGAGLSEEEQKWLQKALKYILVNRPS